MAVSAATIPSTSDVLHFVLHFEGHSQLSAEEVAKAVAWHKREHPDHGQTTLPGKDRVTASRQPKR
jgi:hypothetical protein